MEKTLKNIVVTGAGGGMGKKISKYAVTAGFKIIAIGKDESKLEALQKELGAENVTPIQVDLEDIKATQAIIEFIKKTHGRISWLINNAGYISKNESESVSEVFRKTFYINTRASILMSFGILPAIEENGGVINISSTASIWGNTSYPVYSASKAALNIFGVSMAKKMIGTTIKIITICPGPTNTQMRENFFGDASHHQDPEVVASLIADIIKGTTSYSNGDVVIIKDGQQKLFSSI